MENQPSFKEQRVRKITNLYYSRKDIQQAIFQFSENREICPRYFEGFGKRPDTFQYPSDIFELVKKGATSFHSSEEIWQDPLKIKTGMSEQESNELRTGWDLLIDIDSKYIDYSKISAQVIIEMLKFHGVKNFSIKFSGSKGFHIIVPWNAFPKEINGVKTSDMFPEWARIITQYIMEKTQSRLIEKITDLTRPSKYVKDFQAPKEVMPDIILVSPRHLFRMPYSLHEKTALASVVLNEEELEKFELTHADPLKAIPKNFYPEAEEGEAKELLVQALDWGREHIQEQQEKSKGKFANYKPIELKNISEEVYPPCILNILKGIGDGKKRALFALINFFRSIGMPKEDLEKKIYEWNEKNQVPLKKGYIFSQLNWAYRRKPILPPNCKEFYQGIAVCIPDTLCSRIKNPINYTVRKNFSPKNKQKNKDNFKNKD